LESLQGRWEDNIKMELKEIRKINSLASVYFKTLTAALTIQRRMFKKSHELA
jgi:hypothetical protein